MLKCFEKPQVFWLLFIISPYCCTDTICTINLLTVHLFTHCVLCNLYPFQLFYDNGPRTDLIDRSITFWAYSIYWINFLSSVNSVLPNCTRVPKQCTVILPYSRVYKKRRESHTFYQPSQRMHLNGSKKHNQPSFNKSWLNREVTPNRNSPNVFKI